MNAIRRSAGLMFCMLLALSLLTQAQEKPAAKAVPAWVERSNQYTKIILDSESKFFPEGAARQGVEGLDEEIIDLKPNVDERHRAVMTDNVAKLKKLLAAEKDPLVRQDLEILIKSEEDDIKGSLLREKYELPYASVSRLVYLGLRALLDDQIPASRQKAALVRLHKYAGMEEGYTPVATLAKNRIMERMDNTALFYPAKVRVESDLKNSAFFVTGIEKLFKQYKIEGYEEAFSRFKQQAAAYDEFVKTQILPKARTDFRMPPEEYAFQLQNVGVDIPPAKLTAMAHASFTDIQKQMDAIAAQVAKEKGYSVTGYRDVIRELKKDQITGEAILPHFQGRLKDLENIIREHRLVTLPSRPARIRIASDAETAQQPAPHMTPPRLMGNTGEQGEFVLPLNIPAQPGSKELRYDDFTFSAASWTLTAHEARPGHELQFDSMVEHGVSTARALFAFNSTNVEGWGLYAEAISLPYMPQDGQLISLQLRLLRAARAFLDPELQSGKVTPEQAKHVLMDDVMLSDAFATEEVERFTFRSPGQATSYFYGYTRLMELRADVEKAMGKRFDTLAYHDFILAQGLLPPQLLRKAVMTGYVGKSGKRAAAAGGN